jgi:glyoxylase-like metal-dependent hydrolase (beta-lactamase superfamily II)
VIHAIPIPTPFAVGRVNTYLVEDDPLTLVDTGPNSGKALDELEQALAARGHRVEDLGLIVVTHQHMDHLGLVSILARRAGADVAALDRLAPWMASYAQSMEADDEFSARMMACHGIPEDVRYALRAVSSSFRGWGAAAQVTLELHDGGELALRDRTFRVHHRPGHSPSDTLLHDESEQVLIAGDHLIKHISSNPLLTRPLGGDPATSERPRALMTYMDSLRTTRAMEHVARVLPGHGDPIEDHAALIDERMRLHERRARKLHRMIAERPQSAYELAQGMWGNVAVTQAYLTLSEVLGHVDLLLAEGSVAEEQGADGVVRFSAVSPPPEAPPAPA